MSIKIGDIDVANEIIELHYQLRRVTLLLDSALAKVPGAALTLADISAADSNALAFVKAKFPTMGIVKK